MGDNICLPSQEVKKKNDREELAHIRHSSTGKCSLKSVCESNIACNQSYLGGWSRRTAHADQPGQVGKKPVWAELLALCEAQVGIPGQKWAEQSVSKVFDGLQLYLKTLFLI